MNTLVSLPFVLNLSKHEPSFQQAILFRKSLFMTPSKSNLVDDSVSARAWRPQTFEAVIGQPHVTTALQNAVRRNRVAHAYLLSGIRGTGKTTLARILAKGLNCLDPQAAPCDRCDVCREIAEGRSVDVIEIDGASNTGVDDVRELREMAKHLPMRGRRKVYIIDEAHMLSNAAFNALLKILEEPPPHLVFILATTDAHKMPQTILSRCQHFVLRRLNRSEIIAQLARVAEARGIAADASGLALIAKAAEGSMRDALTLLDQAIAYNDEKITDRHLTFLLGRAGTEIFHRLTGAICDHDAAACLKIACEVAEQGYPLRQFVGDFLEHLRHLIIARQVPAEDGLIDLPKEEVESIYRQASRASSESLQRLFALFAALQLDIRLSLRPHLLFDVALVKAVMLTDLQPIENLIAQIAALGTTTPQDERPPTPRTSDMASSRSMPTPLPQATPPTSPVPKAGWTGSGWKDGGWESLLSEMKQARPNLASYLAQGKWVDMNETAIRIGFSEETQFLMMLLKKEEHAQWLSGFVKERTGRTLLLMPTPSSTPAPPPKAVAPTAAAETQTPLMAAALSVFGGEVV